MTSDWRSRSQSTWNISTFFSRLGARARRVAPAALGLAIGSTLAPPFVTSAVTIVRFQQIAASAREAAPALVAPGAEPLTPVAEFAIRSLLGTPIEAVEGVYGFAIVIAFALLAEALVRVSGRGRIAVFGTVAFALALQVRFATGVDWTDYLANVTSADLLLAALVTGLRPTGGVVSAPLARALAGILALAGALLSLGGAGTAVAVVAVAAAMRAARERPALAVWAAWLAGLGVVTAGIGTQGLAYVVHGFAALPIVYRSYGGVVRAGLNASNGDARYDGLPSLSAFSATLVLAAGAIVLRLLVRPPDDAGATVGRSVRTPLGALAAAAITIPLAALRLCAPGDAPLELSGAVLFVDLALATVAAFGLEALRRRAAVRAEWFPVASGIALAAAFILYGNVRVGDAIGTRAYAAESPVRLVEAARNVALFRRLPVEARLVDISHRSFFGRLPPSAVDAFFEAEGARLASADAAPPGSTWLLDVVPEAGRAGLVSVARTTRDVSATAPDHRLVDRAFAVRFFNSSTLRDERLRFDSARGAGDPTDVVASGPHALMYEALRHCAPVAQRLALGQDYPAIAGRTGFNPFVPQRTTYDFVEGLPYETDLASRLRTAGRRSSFTMAGPACDRRTYTIAFDLVTAAPATAVLTGPAGTVTIATSQVATHAALPFRLDAHGRAVFRIATDAPLVHEYAYSWRIRGERWERANILIGPIGIGRRDPAPAPVAAND